MMRLQILAVVMLSSLAIAIAQTCLVDDIYTDTIVPGGAVGFLSDVTGICPDSITYTFAISPVSAPFDQLDNNLGDSYCFGFVADTASINQEPLLRFYRGTTEVGRILINATSIIYTIDDARAEFIVPGGTRELVFQLCKERDVITLYVECTPIASAEFSHAPFTEMDSILLLGDLSEASRYDGTVEQVYIVSCDEQFGTESEVADLQCLAFDSSCSRPIVPITTAVQLAIVNVSSNVPDKTQVPTSATEESETCNESISSVIIVSAVSLLLIVTLITVIIVQCLLIFRMKKSKDVLHSSNL